MENFRGRKLPGKRQTGQGKKKGCAKKGAEMEPFVVLLAFLILPFAFSVFASRLGTFP